MQFQRIEIDGGHTAQVDRAGFRTVRAYAKGERLRAAGLAEAMLDVALVEEIGAEHLLPAIQGEAAPRRDGR